MAVKRLRFTRRLSPADLQVAPRNATLSGDGGGRGGGVMGCVNLGGYQRLRPLAISDEALVDQPGRGPGRGGAAEIYLIPQVYNLSVEGGEVLALVKP